MWDMGAESPWMQFGLVQVLRCIIRRPVTVNALGAGYVGDCVI